jgi:hypothetical protein
MKMIEVVYQTWFEKEVHPVAYTPYWIDPANPAGRSKRAFAGAARQDYSSDEPPHMPPPHPSSSRAASASRPMDRSSRGRGRGRGLGSRHAHGIAALFSMCHNISADVHELARRQGKTDDNIHRQSVSLGVPLPPRSQDVFLHQPFEDIEQWHQHHYGVPFYTPKDDVVWGQGQSVPPPSCLDQHSSS